MNEMHMYADVATKKCLVLLKNQGGFCSELINLHNDCFRPLIALFVGSP